jgi:hypothetical protein
VNRRNGKEAIRDFRSSSGRKAKTVSYATFHLHYQAIFNHTALDFPWTIHVVSAFHFFIMFKSALPRLSRAIPHNATASKRFLTTAPPHKTSRSWKNSAVRWTLAGGLIYYYNTSTVFAEEPTCMSAKAKRIPIRV